jgi:hypothetical protein
MFNILGRKLLQSLFGFAMRKSYALKSLLKISRFSDWKVSDYAIIFK